jgi:hypothetical protein
MIGCLNLFKSRFGHQKFSSPELFVLKTCSYLHNHPRPPISTISTFSDFVSPNAFLCERADLGSLFPIPPGATRRRSSAWRPGPELLSALVRIDGDDGGLKLNLLAVGGGGDLTKFVVDDVVYELLKLVVFLTLGEETFNFVATRLTARISKSGDS